MPQLNCIAAEPAYYKLIFGAAPGEAGGSRHNYDRSIFAKYLIFKKAGRNSPVGADAGLRACGQHGPVLGIADPRYF